MVRVIEADVPRPLWDEWAGIMIIKPGLSAREKATAIRTLLNERYGGDPDDEYGGYGDVAYTATGLRQPPG